MTGLTYWCAVDIFKPVSIQTVRKFFLIFLAVSLSIFYGFGVGFKTIVLSDIAFIGLLISHGIILFRTNSWKQKLREITPTITIVIFILLLLFFSALFSGKLNIIAVQELFRFGYSFAVLVLISSIAIDSYYLDLISKAIVFTGATANIVSIIAFIIYHLYNIKTKLLYIYAFGLTPIMGFSQSPKTYALLCIFYLTFNIFLVIRHPANKIYKIFLFLNFTSLLLTFQKEMLYLIFLASLIVFFLLKKRKMKLLLSSALIAIFFCLQVVAFFSHVIVFFPTVLREGRNLSKPVFSYPKSGYYYQYSSGMKMFADNPVYGIGLGQYGIHLLEYIDPEDAEYYSQKRWLEPMIPKEVLEGIPFLDDPHSTWFKVAAEAGALGLVGLLSIFIYVIFMLSRKIKTSANVIPSIFLSLIISLMIMAIQFDFIHVKMFWFLMGLALSTCSSIDKINCDSLSESPYRKLNFTRK